MISVVIPVYNNANTIIRAIRSVQNQTMQDFEIIVVDDGSTDSSSNIVKKITDKRITLITQHNHGVSAARNRGIEVAQGEWVTFLDADDEWSPTFLETVCRLREKYSDCTVCATSYYRKSSLGNLKRIILRNVPSRREFVMDNYFEVAACSDPPFYTCSVAVKRETMLSIGGFPIGIHQGEDLLTWARLATLSNIAYCVEPNCIYYITEAHSHGLPRRIPPSDDVVGRELEFLFSQNPKAFGLPTYISLWHKMRASIFMRLPNYESQCRKEIKESLTWNPHNKKIILYRYLLLLPYSLRMTLLKHI